MKYNELKYLGAHTAYVAPKYGYPLAGLVRTNQKACITDQLLTTNEGDDAEMVRKGPQASSAICKIAVRPEGGHGLVDLKYYWK